MKMIRTLGIALALLTSTQVATAASLTNIGFETGNLSGWDLTGTGGVNTTQQFSGSYAGYITNTGVLQQEAYIQAGDKVDFMWRFITNESPGNTTYNDFAFLVNGAYQMLSSVATVGPSGDTGWQYFSWIAPVTYNGSVIFGVVNIGDNIVSSTLLLDAAVPLPGAALLFGSALLGAGALRRKQAAAKKAALAVA